MPLVYNYLFPVMWLSFLALLVGDFEERQRNRAPGVRGVAPDALIFDCLRGGASLASQRSARFAKRAISSSRHLVFLERRGRYRRWSPFCRLGTSSPREKLEPGRHLEGRSRTHYQWPLRPGSPPYLYRASAGVCRLRNRPRRMARATCCGPCLRRALAQTEA
jgi:hypothetical protein